MPVQMLAVCAVAEPGGAELGLVRLLRRLGGRGWAITLAAPAGGALQRIAADHGWRWQTLGAGPLSAGPRSASRALRSWPRARTLAREADVVYLNGTVSARLLPAVAARRTVLHVHDVVQRVPRFWRMADVVLADSHAVARAVPGLPAQVVWCPVELDPPHVAAPWPATDGPVIGFVGRIEPRKGPLDLVRAAPAIRAGAPGARIVIIGGDPYRSDPDYVARVQSIKDDVEHHPWFEEAAGLMRHLAVLVVPSRQEPFGTVAAEAMAVGTPVVASAVGGLPEVVQDGVSGALVPPGDPVALAAGVLRVLADREALGRGARRAARRFDADVYADRVQALIAPT